MEVAPQHRAVHCLQCLHCLHCLYCSDYFKLLKQYHVCLYVLLGEVRMLLEWADELLSKKRSVNGWVMADG